MEFEWLDAVKNAKEKPDVEPILLDKHPSAFNPDPRNLVKTSQTGRMYLLLKSNPDKAFTTAEIGEAIGELRNTTLLNNLYEKGFVFKSKFPVPTGKTFDAAV